MSDVLKLEPYALALRLLPHPDTILSQELLTQLFTDFTMGNR
jgi:hypothetical protein